MLIYQLDEIKYLRTKVLIFCPVKLSVVAVKEKLTKYCKY